jgi:hypothetical protein
MYIVSGVVQEGAMWPLQPAYDLLLQAGTGLYRTYEYIYLDIHIYIYILFKGFRV